MTARTLERWTIRGIESGKWSAHINSGGKFPGSWGRFTWAAAFDLSAEYVEVVHPPEIDPITREAYPSIKKGIDRGWDFWLDQGRLVTSLVIEISRVTMHPPDPHFYGSSHGSNLLFDLVEKYGAASSSIDPAWLAWEGGTVRKLARGIRGEEGFDHLPVLGDALEEAGCADADILSHLRSPGPHVRGCWVLDLLLDRK